MVFGNRNVWRIYTWGLLNWEAKDLEKYRYIYRKQRRQSGASIVLHFVVYTKLTAMFVKVEGGLTHVEETIRSKTLEENLGLLA